MEFLTWFNKLKGQRVMPRTLQTKLTKKNIAINIKERKL